jgi:D-glycero-D-manno-heptose 1,7-bisphosphate phosphatase
MNKAIFLDRDGVINQAKVVDGKPFPPEDIDECKILPKVKKALKMLKKQGFFLIVITNQPDVARKKINIKTVQAINEFLEKSLPIDAFFACYHDDIENCNCRKPKPGNIFEAAKQYNINLQNSFMVGDRWRDIEAGKNAGCKTFFIDYSYQEKQPMDYDYKVKSLYEAAEVIIKN